ncbi:tetratricopeptide repeat protein [Sphingomonas qomolangmaensis]|uniref:Tetratricopeptide repeat protein n=1 Tax=Sphingomonas qomolangmaensis TaxID=2918765 RepID=A0ABY5L916_9SPHN|nr:hypothetical protein [Sphingomonas qomolangmaensis]UUL82214.1 hypothetical protein NMP03_13645 [Sphingomonas qomolangmaensis]
MMRWLLVVVGAALSLPAHAQLTAPVKNGETTITVTGTKIRDAKVEMSDWRMAETPHVVVFSQGDEKDLIRTAHNLEKLHFLLSALTGKVDEPDETIKVAVTMIGDVGTFEQLRLTDLRWQYGPFPRAFAKTIYYDPRDEGSVLATTQDGVNLVLRPSVGRPTNRNCDGGDGGFPPVTQIVVAPRGELGEVDANDAYMQMPVNELAFCQSAESRLYAGFAQNYLMTYSPAAYPRWFLQGFGEMFATMAAGDDFVEYGQLPTGFFQVMEHFGGYPVSHILDGRYLSGKGRAWTPYHAWRLSHLLYFSDEWKPRLREYLDALARGADLQSAARALGDPAALQSAVTNYRGRKLQAERMTFPAERAPPPTVRRLTRAEAGLIRGRLELGARIEVPDAGPDRERALARRTAWLDRLRANARQFPDLIEHQLLLAEAECRTGNPEACLGAADRVIAQAPTETRALVWKGTALTQLAARAPQAERRQRLEEARSFIVKANRQDPESSLPLIAYHESFATAGEQAPDVAVEGLYKIVQSAPAAPGPRLKLGEELVARDLAAEARRTLLPVAKGPFETPEKPAAAALLPKAGAGAGG